jgi:MFS family permease
MGISSFFARHTGLATLLNAPRDIHLIITMRCLRLSAFGSMSLIIVSYLKNIGLNEKEIGYLLTTVVIGDLILSFSLALISDSIGRRNVLFLSSFLMTITGVILFLFPKNLYVVAAVLFLGIVTHSGGEVGPFRSIEQSAISSLCKLEDRSDIFTWYTFNGNVSSGLGSVIIGYLVTETDYGTCFAFYSAIGALLTIISLLLSEKIEIHQDITLKQENEGEQEDPSETSSLISLRRIELADDSRKGSFFLPNISAKSLPTLLLVTFLIDVDSLGLSITSKSWTVYYFLERYSLPSSKLGVIFGVASFISGASVLVSSYISRRIGPLKTMVITHTISSILLTLQALPIGYHEMTTLFLIRATVRAMDLPSKHVFISMVVKPSERTTAIGFINASKTLIGAVAPIISGYLSSKGLLWSAFLIAGLLKLTYDAGLFFKFVGKYKDH